MKPAISRWSRATTKAAKGNDFCLYFCLSQILPIHVQSLDVTFNAPQFPNHLTCRQLQPPKGNDPSITHYLTPSNHPSFFYHLHFNSKQIILSKRLPP
ncbi:hypothetical protein D0Y65_047720 [Glycine soja]|uniref:Uncharacterized protein n=1 Tax=Glycine soja TaxID=3848 RepID=A0A445FQ28_GLYSO|nr:hypothetical protein D0Y65_047720 [Glycine soja]